jgi:hypothetical protein
MDDELKELDGTPDRKSKNIIEVNEEWPWYQRLAANIINASGTFIWIVVTYLLLRLFNGNAELVALRNASLNIVVPTVAYGLLSLIAYLTLSSWLFPYFSYRRMIKDGTPLERAACCLFWGLIALSGAIIIAAGIR